jgi:hypothetical protein
MAGNFVATVGNLLQDSGEGYDSFRCTPKVALLHNKVALSRIKVAC